MSLIDDYKNGKRYGTDWQAPSFQHMNDLVGTVSDADDKADNALSKSTTAENNSTNALTKATTAETNSTNAVNTANTANSNSQAAVTTANNANTKSDQAISTANDADTKATNAETTVNNLTQPPDVSEANKFGVVNVEIIGTETNDEKFKFSNLKGNGIATIAKTGSNGLQDIYTITFDNGGTFSFNVTNGKSITNISKTNTSGLVDTYTITYNDASTSIFTITNGDSIELRVEDGYLQWKYTTSSTWNNLISLGELSNVDQELSETSTNAIANSAVTQELNKKINASDLLNKIYPVGSIYMSVNSTNPSTLFGGTWEQFAQGRVLLGVGSNGETNYTTAEQTGGSENSVASHTHTQQEHNHTQQSHHHALLSNTEKNANANGFGANNKIYGISGVYQDRVPDYQYYPVDNAGHSYVGYTKANNNPTTAVNNSTGEVGGNRMPFITCYIWKRTA